MHCIPLRYDRGLCLLGGLSAISSLNLDGTRVSDQALKALADKQVYHLVLDKTAITDNGLLRVTLMLADCRFGHDRIRDPAVSLERSR